MELQRRGQREEDHRTASTSGESVLGTTVQGSTPPNIFIPVSTLGKQI